MRGVTVIRFFQNLFEKSTIDAYFYSPLVE